MDDGPPLLFDRRAVRTFRDRAADRFGDHDFLPRAVAERLLDRLDDVKRSFPLALDLGCGAGLLGAMLAGRGGVETLVRCDLSPRLAARAGRPRLAADAEALPFADGRLDLVLSCLALHAANDLPGALIQIRRALRPDGLFLAALFGGRTLWELREAWAVAEAEIEGGAGPRVAPFADVRTAGDALARAGFALPVADRDTLTVSYPDVFRLMADLRGMGEANALAHRRRTFTRRATLLRMAAVYGERFAGPDGRVPATFEILFLTGWAPHPAQPRPLKPGSARHRLADALGAGEG